MASIKSYMTKSGKKRYEFHMYGGLNPQTGNPKKIHRRGFKTKKEASLSASRIELELENGTLQKDNNILFKDVFEQWYVSYINTVRESTYARTMAMFNNHILPAFGKLRIRTITTAQIQKAVNKWFKLAPVSGFKRWYNYTASVFDYAILHNYITGENPAKRITLPKKPIVVDQEENFYNQQQIAIFFSHIDPEKELEKFTLFRLLCFSGIRRGECLALQWQDVSFKNQTLTINRTLTQGIRGSQIIQPPKTAAGYRTISLDDKTMNYLKQWRT